MNFIFGEYSTTTDYYYSLEQWIKNTTGQSSIYVGSSYFNNHEWAMYARVINSYLVTGYITRKNVDYIDIYTYIKINDSLNSAFENYLKTLNLKDSGKEAIDNGFEKLDELIEIIN